MTGVLASEWLKLRSVRSTYVVLGVVVAGVLLAGLLAAQEAALWDRLSPVARGRLAPMPVEQAVLPLIQLCLAVLGVLVVTAEYGTGTIRASLVAVPRRLTLLWAKGAVVAATALTVAAVAMLAIFVASSLVIGARPIPGNATSLPAALPLLLASGASVLVLALVGLGLGTMLRSGAGAIVTVVMLLVALPTFAYLLPPPWADRVGSIMLPSLPGQLADSGSGATTSVAAVFAGGSPGGGALLSPAGALVVMAGYVAAALAGAAVAIGRRDA
jgi:ABC-2 type transport system permease protein